MKQFDERHPDITFLGLSDIDTFLKKLLQFEIGAGRQKPDGAGYEFVVTLTFQHRETGKEIKDTQTYMVVPKNNRWLIALSTTP